MRRYWLSFGLLVAAALPLKAAEPPREEKPARPGSVYVVAIGQQDDWKFLPEGFERAVREQGQGLYRDFHSRILTGPRATRKELLDGVAWMCDKARADDLVMLFIACHGGCTPRGESVFATRTGSVRPREIKALLAKAPCQAVVVNDACCSGNWPKEFDGDPMPPNVTALCCCLATQSSGIQFDITLFEALYGKADYNKDGVVDLDEVIRYCRARIREVEGGRLTPVLHKAKSLRGPLQLTKANPGLVGVVHHREVFAAVVEKQDGGAYFVRVIGFDKPGRAGLGGGRLPDRYGRAGVILPGDGAPLMVRKDKGGWFPACLVGKQGDSYRIRYVGTTGAAEVVSAERVRHLFGADPGETIPPGLFARK